jgi:hypothetical protein
VKHKELIKIAYSKLGHICQVSYSGDEIYSHFGPTRGGVTEVTVSEKISRFAEYETGGPATVDRP